MEIEADVAMVMTSLKSIDSHLAVLSAVARLPYVYPAAGTSARLIEEYRELLLADAEAFSAIAANELEEKLSYEERARVYGEVVAKMHVAPMLAAIETRKKTLEAINTFQKEHPLIVLVAPCGV